MKNFISLSIILSFLLIISSPLKGQHFLSTNGKAIVNENQDTILLRGMGLGGWMVQEGYMLQTADFASPQHKIKAIIKDLIGTANTDAFYEAWLANHVRRADIDSLKAWGFNSVRLPMHYNLYTLPIEDEPIPGQHTWLDKGFELTDSLISWCKQNEMYVILDLHAAPGGQGYDAAISDYDDSKPSLWESEENRDKTVAFWKKIAEKYVDEQWVAGYDLLNEVNWDIPGGAALANLYKEITDSIRTVDNQHIIFIEGNWFANDFTGLTPPWDDNIVYSPHKYWSFNDKATMQWVLDIRNDFNVPLYLGESGENSNTWFRDAIRLLEDLDIGWAWWPEKKIESISGPMSIVKTSGYQTLLDYWNGNGPKPTAQFATAALMEIAEGLKIENCAIQKDVIDAMFRQVHSDETVPFKKQTIPGVIYATDFDMGMVGEAYFDNDVANYHVSTGNFTTWNNGWIYRNDGVDIEPSTDNINTNGFNVGWLETGEWMQYEVDIESSGVYKIQARTASGGSGGKMHFAVGNTAITPSVDVAATGGWQDWQMTFVQNVILDESDTKIRFYVDESGFNLGSFQFIKTEVDITSLATEFVASNTVDEYNIQLNTNKHMSSPVSGSLSDFEISVDGSNIPILSVDVDEVNPRILKFNVDYNLKSTETIKISYSGTQVNATDGTSLASFTLEDVTNNLTLVHQIPVRIQAEAYSFQSGVVLENTSDEGGGKNIGFLDPGDYLEYEVNVTAEGEYNVDYRTAAEYGGGAIEMSLLDNTGNEIILDSPSFPVTEGWQTWTTTSSQLTLPAGRHTLRILITASPFNMNWFQFSSPTSTIEVGKFLNDKVKIYPNPGNAIFNIKADLQEPQHVNLRIFNTEGEIVLTRSIKKNKLIQEQLNLEQYPSGLYYVMLQLEDGSFQTQKLVKLK